MTVIVPWSAYNHIGVPVTIYVPGPSYRVAEQSRSLVSLPGPGGRGGYPRGRTNVDKCRPLIDLTIVVPRSSNNHIGVAVTVYVSRTGHRHAMVGRALVAL